MLSSLQKTLVIAAIALIAIIFIVKGQTPKQYEPPPVDSAKEGAVPDRTDRRQPPQFTSGQSDFGIKEKAYLDMIANDPDNPEIYSLLGDLYFENKLFEKAIPNYKKAIQLSPSDVDNYNDLGLAQFYTRRSEEAIKTLKKGMEVDPGFQRIWLSYGFVNANSGDIEESKRALEKVISLNDTTSIAEEARRILGILNEPK